MTLTDKWTKGNVILGNLQLSALLLDIDMKKTFLGQGQDKQVPAYQKLRVPSRWAYTQLERRT